MTSTREQRIQANYQIGLRRGLDPDKAMAEAYRLEGLPPPAPPRDEVQELREQLERALDTIEELHDKLHCAERRANASCERARILARRNRELVEENRALGLAVDRLEARLLLGLD